VKGAFQTCLLIDPIQAYGLSGKHPVDTPNSRIHRHVELFPSLLATGCTRLPRR
jgi:hypothetical protein